MTALDTALLVLRLWLAIVMIAHGIHHARSLEGTASWFASKGFRQAPLQARFSAVGELSIGAALALGFLTSFAAAGLIATMTVAYWTIHRQVGFFVFHRPDEGYEYVATLGVSAAVLAVAGPGRAAIDSGIGVADRLDGWTGAVIALAGIVAAAGQLALFWRSPSKGTSSPPTEPENTGAHT